MKGVRRAPRLAGWLRVSVIFRTTSVTSASRLARDELLDEHLNDGRRRHRQDRANNAQQLSAHSERDDHGDGAQAKLPDPDLRNEDMVFELLLHRKEHDHADG